ncbi:MAG: 3-oxoacyl-[acyl-carrier protein] reductase [uncultured Thermomicrobiales bacterium]|uniref:3-oxoacyl-[acyl-carrier protein] reductase n=1 Tax=uncultured Thermomicrobiales bacterium TaxID=1645740 RepID=A0A6J4VAW1_9BACT|nr:MAG: 3-oxoacyl-[acyl-carrier protein] reductase [uncultured Thermomicrobiales bacterium]
MADTGDGTKGAALVTGASSGIGRELASLLARDGHPLVLVARRREELDRVAGELGGRHGVAVETIGADLSESEAVGRVVDELERRGIAVETLVNNAGFGAYGPFAEGDTERELAMVRLNVEAVTHLTRRLLPGMIERRRGRVLNVASTAAFQPGPLMAVYFATKAYVLSFSEALAEEVRGTGVTVTALCPGPTATEFGDRAGLETSKLFQRGVVMEASTVAAIGYAGMRAGKTLVIPGAHNWLLAESVRFAPRAAVTRLVKRMQERVDAS